MPLLEIRDFPEDLYEQLRYSAEKYNRTIEQQVILLIKKGLEGENSIKKERQLLLERIMKRDVPEEAKDFDFVKAIREDRER